MKLDNGTDFNPEKSVAVQLVVYIAFEIVIATLAFLNNILVLIAILKYKHLHTGTCWLVASLACADMGVAALAIPGGIILRMGLLLSSNTAGNSATLGNSQTISISLCFVSVSSALIFTQVSIFNLLVIGFDRYLSMYYSLRYKAIVTSTRVKVCILMIWILGTVIGLIPQANFFIDQTRVFKLNKTTIDDQRCTFGEVINMKFMVYVNSILCMFLPLLLMLVLYSLVFKSANKQLRKIYSDVLQNPRKSKVSLLSLKEFWKLDQKSVESENNPTRRIHNALHCIRKLTEKKSRSLDVTIRGDYCFNVDWGDSNKDINKNTCKSESASQLVPKNTMHNLILNRENSLKETNSPSTKFDKTNKLKLPHHQSSVSRSVSSFDLPSEPYQDPEVIEKRPRKQSSISLATSSSFSGGCESDNRKKRTKRKWKFIQKEIRAARSLSTTVGVFALCWLPLNIHYLLVYFRPEIGVHQPIWLVDVAILLSHANSMINPIIYAFHLRDIRTSFRKMFKQLKTFLINFIRPN